MNFDKIGQFTAAVVLAAAASGQLDTFNHWVQVATAKIVWESRTEKWGSPIFFPDSKKSHKKPITKKEVRNTD